MDKPVLIGFSDVAPHLIKMQKEILPLHQGMQVYLSTLNPIVYFRWGKHTTNRELAKIHIPPVGKTYTICFNPVLDSVGIPAEVLMSFLWHEYVHIYKPPFKEGDRWINHYPEFHEVERRDPNYYFSNRWIRENL
jgi:hypothetical protein